MVQDEVVIEEPAPIDFDWCEETSNCGDLILDQDIPAALEEEVVTNSSEADATLPVAPPPPLPKPRTISVSSNPRSLLKVNYLAAAPRPPSKFRKTLMVNKSLLKAAGASSSTESTFVLPSVRLPGGVVLGKKPSPPPPPPPKPAAVKVPIIEAAKSSRRSIKDAPKFRQTVKLPKKEMFTTKKMNYLAKQLKQRNMQQQKKPSERSDVGGNSLTAGGKGKRGKKFVDLHGENITINHDVESGSTLDPRRPPVDEDSRVVSVNNKSKNNCLKFQCCFSDINNQK